MRMLQSADSRKLAVLVYN